MGQVSFTIGMPEEVAARVAAAAAESGVSRNAWVRGALEAALGLEVETSASVPVGRPGKGFVKPIPKAGR